MNQCILEVEVKKTPTLRFTQDQKTPISEMEVEFEGLRAEDSPGNLKVVGWGRLAEELQNSVHLGQRLVIEGRLRMNTVPRQDGTKEKQAELTLSKLHVISQNAVQKINNHSQGNTTSKPSTSLENPTQSPSIDSQNNDDSVEWNSAPLVPDTDDIPF